MGEVAVKGADIIIVAIFVLWAGNWITRRVDLLSKYSIPVAVTGGLLCSVLVAVIGGLGGPKFIFDMSI